MTVEVVPPSDEPPDLSAIDMSPSPKPAKQPKRERSENIGAARDMNERAEANVRDWLSEVAADVAFKVAISRRMPQKGPKGENIAGALETVDGEYIDEDYIRENWGGGTFNLQVMTMRHDGRYKLLAGRQLKIAGPPKMNGISLGGDGTSAAAVIDSGDTQLADRAMSTMERMARNAEARADKAERHGGLDIEALSTLQAPMIEQLRAAQETVAQLQQQVLAMATRPADRDPFRDKLLETMLSSEQGRVETLRATYESRIDKLRESHDDRIEKLIDNHQTELKRIEDRHEREIKGLESRHERELSQARESVTARLETVKSSNDTRIDALKSDIARLERELVEKNTKIGSLEARKDQTIGEKADELIKVKEALDGIGGDGDGDKKWWEVALDTIGNSEAAISMVNRIAGGPPAPTPGQPQQTQLPPPGVPFQTGDGNVYVRDEHNNTKIIGTVANVPRGLVAARKKRRTGLAEGSQQIDPGAQQEEEPAPAPRGRPPSGKEAKMAVAFMENAIKRGADPVDFARSARNLVPGGVLTFIGQVGIDKFLNTVGLEQGSPLTSVRGRQFARAVAKVLLEGDMPPPDEPEEVEQDEEPEPAAEE